jgi:hypothetical protein
MLSRGTTVTIYEDPITKQRPEGNATVVNYVQTLEPGRDQYVVHFIGDAENFHVVRTIDEAETALSSKALKNEWTTCGGCGKQFIMGKTGVATKQGNRCNKCTGKKARVQ